MSPAPPPAPPNPTDLVMNVAAQLQAQLGVTAFVTVSGSTVTVTSPHGLPESDWERTAITLPTTVAAPTITKSVITRTDEQGNEKALNYSSGAATGILNKNLIASARVNQTEAVAAGGFAYQFTMPSLAGIDAVTQIFGSEEATAGRKKKLEAVTLDMNNGVGNCNPCM